MTFYCKIAALSASAVMVSCSGGGLAERSLADLDVTLGKRDFYEAAFKERISSYMNIYDMGHDTHSRYMMNARIAEEYSAYNLDSTLAYLNKNVKLSRDAGDDRGVMEAELRMVEVYSKAGYHLEASSIISDYLDVEIPNELKYQYLSARHTLSGELMVYSSDHGAYERYFEERNMLRDSLMNYTEPGSYEWYDLNREAALTARDSASVRELSRKMMDLSKDNYRNYAKACYLYSEGVPKSQPDSIIYWLCKSAEADICSATKDYAALNILSQKAFRLGDVNRAFRYAADYCMTDALSYNGKLRPWQISQFFPLIEHSYELRQRSQTRTVYAALALMSILLAAVVLLLVHIYRHHVMLARTNAKLKSLNARIKESDKIKEEYIALFLGIVSDNISKTRKYQSHVLKYLKRGDGKYLMEEIEQQPSIDGDIKQFYRMFDETFMNLYPDFIEKFNALLADGEEIVPKNDILTPELRVFALIRLGVTDSGKIASLLHYSANTVYNYRAKIKNKSRGPRETFEESVREMQ